MAPKDSLGRLPPLPPLILKLAGRLGRRRPAQSMGGGGAAVLTSSQKEVSGTILVFDNCVSCLVGEALCEMEGGEVGVDVGDTAMGMVVEDTVVDGMVVEGEVKVESEVRKVGGEVRKEGGEVTGVEGDVTSVEGKVTVVEGEVTAVEDEVTAVEGEVTQVVSSGREGG